MWSGPSENEQWQAQHEEACRWFHDKTAPMAEDSELPYRVHKQRWTFNLDAELWIDLVYWRDTDGWNYRAVCYEGTIENFDSLQAAMDALERCFAVTGAEGQA